MSPNAKGQAIDNLTHPKDRFIYQDVINGKELKSTPLQETTNFRYTVTPDNFGSTGVGANSTQARSVYLKVEVKKIDPKTGEWSAWVPFDRLGVEGKTQIPLEGPQAKSIDDVKNELDKLYQYHLMSSNEVIRNRNKTIVQAPVPPNAETIEEARKRILSGK